MKQKRAAAAGAVRETTHDPTLAILEARVCDFLAANQAGTTNPYHDGLLGDADRDSELKALGNRLGYRYAGATLSNFQRHDAKVGPVVDRLSDFALRMPEILADGGGLLLFGPPGTGKDHLLAALLKIAIARHRLRVEWWDGVSLHAEFRRLMDSDSETEASLLRRLTSVHVLAISDPVPPAGELSNYQLTTLRDVIDRRYRKGKTFWMTTNLSKRKRAEELLTEPIMQRLRERSAQINCDWPSWRDMQQVHW